jgi:hypothetical protein
MLLARSAVILAFLATTAAVSASAHAGAAIIRPGEDAPGIVGAAPAGTTFVFAAGLHRSGGIVARDGDRFEGETGAVLTGAIPLYRFVRESDVWMAQVGLSRPAPNGGVCEKDATGKTREACKLPEDLYVAGVEQDRAESRADLAPGRWWADYATGKVYLGADPGAAQVEIAIRPAAIQGAARDVAIRGLVIERYASPPQWGAIQGHEGSGWLVEGNEIRLNHGLGLRIGPRMVVRDNYVHSNGELGLGGSGNDILVEHNVLARNNRLRFSGAWEAGATKFVMTKNLLVRNNCVHNNIGPGLWLDIDNVEATIERNIVFENDRAGIVNEISGSALIRDNVVARNGYRQDNWLWNAQILIANSRDTTVERNTVVVAREGGHGIAVIQQKRGSGGIGDYNSHNNVVRDNIVADFSKGGLSGAIASDELEELNRGNNRFDENRYVVSSSSNRHWAWNGYRLDWQGMREAGQETNGSVVEDLGEARRTMASALDPVCPGPERRSAQTPAD